MTTPRLILFAGAGKSTLTARLMKPFGLSLGVLLDAAISAGRLTLALLKRALQQRKRVIDDSSGRDFRLVASLARGMRRRSSDTGWWTPPESEE